MALALLAAPALEAARGGASASNAGSAYVAEILTDLLESTRECAALWAPRGEVLREGDRLHDPDLADALGCWRARARAVYRGAVAAGAVATGWSAPRRSPAGPRSV